MLALPELFLRADEVVSFLQGSQSAVGTCGERPQSRQEFRHTLGQ